MIMRRYLGVLMMVGLLVSPVAHAQRQMESLSRGVVAVRKNSTQNYISWRLLATDPADIGFNLYRTQAGVTLKLNPLPLTNTTDYLDTTSTASTNAYYVRAVLGGVEQSPSPLYVLPAGVPTRQYLPLPLQPVYGGNFPPYDVKFCWVGDFDGDGEFDYLVDRLSTVAAANQFLQAYKRDGTLLWQMNMGHNSTNQYSHEPGSSAISVGHGDNVTVYDLDGDGKAEVVVRTANGVTVTNAALQQVASITAPSDVTQFISIIDGMTGVERARATVPNPFPTEGPIAGHMGIMYCDGVRPSVLYQASNRNNDPGGDEHFNMTLTVWDFRDGAITQRWSFQRGYNDYAEGHQIRIADVDGDGKDEFQEIGFAVDDNGQLLWDNKLVHGDRFHTTDIDPDRAGLETFAIQQYNPTLLATMLYDAATGNAVKEWYAGGVVDVGRGITLDMDPNYRGCEMYSTQPGIFDAKGNQIWVNNLWAPEALWWDGDVLREFIDGAGSGALSPVVNKFNPSTGGSDRLYSIYNEGVHQAYGGRSAFWGDILGDWREELVLVANDYSEIRIYTTTTSATNRNYCLMQNPQYRVQATTKGYYQANYPDYYLGHQMQPAGVPTYSSAQIVWRGNGANDWDASTLNWFTNNLWISNTTPVIFAAGNHVLFDLTGSNHAAVNLVGSLLPGTVTVNSPKDYTFAGAGELAGTNRLVKAGRGKLTLSGTNTYTGATTVWEGPLIVNGALPASPVTVRGGIWHDGAVSGTGFIGQGVTLHRNAAVSPGLGTNSPGTLTISNGLALTGGAVLKFDLSDDPTGTLKTNDLVQVLGNLTLTSSNRIHIHRLNGALPTSAVYPLVNYTGTLSGSLSNLIIEGLPGVPVALTNPPGQIALVVKSYRAPAALTWTGGLGGNVWDLVTTSNFLNGAAKDYFAPGDTVRLDATGTSNLTVNLSGYLIASNLVVDSTANYTIAGNGVILGNASLTKSNTGTLTITAKNSTFTGRTLLAGGTLVVSELGAIGWPSSLGNPPGGSTNLVFANSPTLRITAESYTDRGMTLNAGTNTLEIANAADQLTTAGLLVGAGALRKTGPGLLALTVSNAYTGGTLIEQGSVSLGGVTANQRALGTGLVTLNGGTLRMYDDDGSWEGCGWNLNVPTGTSGSLYADRRCTLTGTLTGGGTLNFYIPYVRTELAGNWSAFTGVINALTVDADGGDFRIVNSSGYANATLNVASNIYVYHTTSGTSVSLGAVSGSLGGRLSGAAWTVGAKNTNTTFAGNIASSSITKVGAGTWTLTGSNYYTGSTTVSGGTLMVNGNNGSASGAVTVANTATLAGTGIIGGSTVVQSGGRLAPGSNAIGTLTFNGNLAFNSGSVALIEINKTSGTKDLADAGGTLTYGGTLQVTNLSGTLTNGDSFKIFDATTYAGTFATFNLPALAPALAWNTSNLTVNGTLSVIANGAIPPAPAAPTNLIATAITHSQINLTWTDASTNETNFLIEQSTNGVNFTQIASLGAGVSAYTNSGLSGSTLYYYRVRASNAGGFSDYTSVASASTLATPAQLVWRGDGSGNVWDVGTTANWRNAGSPSVFANDVDVLFDDTGSNNTAVALTGQISPSAVLVAAAKNYTLAGTGSLTNGMSLTKTGAGTLTLSSPQGYSGGTFVGGGTLALTTSGEVGSGSITFSNGTTFLLSGSSVFKGAPVSVVAGATVTMNSGVLANGYSGSISSEDDQATFIIAGPVSMDGQNLKQFQGFTGTVQINSGAQLRYSKTSGLNNGGDLTKFVVNGSLFTRNAGAVACGSLEGTGSITGPASADGVSAFTIGALGIDSTFYGSFLEFTNTRTISLTKVGGGTLTLAGANGYSQTTTISGGALQIGEGGTTGTLPTNNIVNNATLIFNRANTVNDSGVISGTGSVVLEGDGTVNFSRNHTYSGQTLINVGRLAMTGNASLSNSPLINIASGAVLDVSARTGGSLTFTTGKTLSGSGAINGSITLASGAKLVPGNSLGTLTFSNNLTLAAGSSTTFEITRPPVDNDRLDVLGSLSLGGVLIVTNVSGNALVAGDSFQLFTAPLVTGNFSSVSLPPLSNGLVWNTNTLATDGFIAVVSPIATVPTNLTFTATGGTLTLTWPASHTGWVLQAQTNVLGVGLGPVWFDVPGSTATNQFSVPLNPANPTVFYRLALP
jgi:autotransporter-associated beta strand protein